MLFQKKRTRQNKIAWRKWYEKKRAKKKSVREEQKRKRIAAAKRKLYGK